MPATYMLQPDVGETASTRAKNGSLEPKRGVAAPWRAASSPVIATLVSC